MDLKEYKKYYTPNIEEFHVGFEYEYLTNGDEWVKHIINNKADLIDCIEDIKESKIRVKYLDKEDIESLGFGKMDFSFYQNFIRFKRGRFDIYMSLIHADKTKVLIFRKDYSVYTECHYSKEVFSGTLKNKSELKRLLKQLDIKYDRSK